MATRVVEWKRPYTWWKAISIDENKVISLNLRDENNLIIYDRWDDEIYVDLQLPDEIRPTDAFPVWVTTGRVIVDNGWDVTGTLISAKTTSGDIIKLLYGDNWKLYIDNGTGTFKQIYLKWEVDTLLQNLRTYIDTELAKKQDVLTAGFGLSIDSSTNTIINTHPFDPVNSQSSWQVIKAGGLGNYYWANESPAVSIATQTPSTPTKWMLWFDTTSNELNLYDGTQWITLIAV
jgi:hypothetical protein